jgi:hypothetical protein
MKKSLFATVAAVALFTATSMAVAAEGGRDHGSKPEMGRGADGGAQLKGKAETTGAGADSQADMKPGSETEHGVAPKHAHHGAKADGAKADGAKADADKSSRTGPTAAERTKSSTTGEGSAQKEAPAAKSNESEKTPSEKSAADEKSGAAASKPSAQSQGNNSAGGSASLTSDQKTKIRTTVLKSGNAPKVSRSSINFNIRIGTVIPRSVHFVTVPETIIEIHPAWRGYSYFVVDDEIIIVEPRSLEIVAILEV